jgi:hypothetical protein
MALKVGDKVKFLNDVGGGIVTKIKQQTVYVESNDGFEIPTNEAELIKIEKEEFGNFKIVPETKIIKPDIIIDSVSNEQNEFDEQNFENDFEGIITSENCTLNILLGIVPLSSTKKPVTEFQIYLISDCAYRVLYTFSIVKENFCYGRKAGWVEEDTKININTISIDELKEIQAFKIGCIFYKKGIFLPHEPIIYEYKIDTFVLTNTANWHDNDYFNEKAVIINITEESLIYEIERTVTENEEKYIVLKKKKESKPKRSEDKIIKDIEEVDLHIEQLIDNITNLSNGEILDIQMSRFHIALEGAIRNKLKKIIFIHGIGNGKLKHEIRKTLDSSKYSHYKYQDASFKEYGYGATLVILK